MAHSFCHNMSTRFYILEVLQELKEVVLKQFRLKDIDYRSSLFNLPRATEISPYGALPVVTIIES